MTNEEHQKAFHDFYEAVAYDSNWDFIKVPRHDRLRFWRYCFENAVRGSDGGNRYEVKGTQVAKIFLLGYESATSKQVIQRTERVYINSIEDR